MSQRNPSRRPPYENALVYTRDSRALGNRPSPCAGAVYSRTIDGEDRTDGQWPQQYHEWSIVNVRYRADDTKAAA